MHKREKKRKRNKNPGSVKNIRSGSETQLRITRGLETKEVIKEAKRQRLKKLWKANPCHQKVIKYTGLLDSILVIQKND